MAKGSSCHWPLSIGRREPGLHEDLSLFLGCELGVTLQRTIDRHPEAFRRVRAATYQYVGNQNAGPERSGPSDSEQEDEKSRSPEGDSGHHSQTTEHWAGLEQQPLLGKYVFHAVQQFEGDYVEYSALPTIDSDGRLSMVGSLRNGTTLNEGSDLSIQVVLRSHRPSGEFGSTATGLWRERRLVRGQTPPPIA